MRRITTLLIVTALIFGLSGPVTTLAAEGDNQPPIVTAPGSIVVIEDNTSALTGISFADPDAGSGSVTVTFSVPSGTLNALSGTEVTAAGSGTGTLTLTGAIAGINAFIAASGVTFTTAPNATSNVTLTVHISDNGHTGDGGALTDSTTATLTVSAVNDAPVNHVPGAQTVTRNETLVFSAANGNQISVSDADAGGGTIQVTLTVTNAYVTLSGTSGLSFIVGSGASDATMTFQAAIADINMAMNGLTFTPTPGYTGAASLQIVSNDLGLSGSGGTQTDTDTIAISVLPVYNANDFSKLRTFLNQPSAVSGQTNGQQINAAYHPDNPTTWTGVAWSSTEPHRVVSIGALGEWYNKSLAGPLDLSGLSQLTYLLVTQNNLTSLNVSGAAALETIFCFDNSLTSLTLSGNTSLVNIYCSDNLLTSLDLSGAPNLNGIQCGSNDLTSLNVTANAALQNLYCGDNQLASLDVSHNAALASLSCAQNVLSQLNVRHNPALTELTVANNQLTALDVSANPLLTGLFCSDNALSALDIRANTALEQLACDNNALTALDISRNTALTRLICDNNQIASLSFANNPAVTHIECRANRLTSLDLRALAASTELNCSDNRLTSIQAVSSGANISVTANGNGYVELRLFNPFLGDAPQVTAVAGAGAPFIRWTDSGVAVSATETYTLTAGSSYSLTAHFLSLTASVPTGNIYTGGRITLTPTIPGGTWGWDEEYFSATFNSPATFTALKAGTSSIIYTVDGVSTSYEVTIEQSELPGTGQDFTWVWALAAFAIIAVVSTVFLKHRKSAGKQGVQR